MLYRSESESSTKLAREFSEKLNLNCELCSVEGYDFEVLEVLRIPVVFIVDRSDGLQEFLMRKEKDLKDIRAYRRRHLNNLRFAVVDAGDLAYSQFVDRRLSELGGKRIVELISGEENERIKKFINNYNNAKQQ